MRGNWNRMLAFAFLAALAWFTSSDAIAAPQFNGNYVTKLGDDHVMTHRVHASPSQNVLGGSTAFAAGRVLFKLRTGDGEPTESNDAGIAHRNGRLLSLMAKHGLAEVEPVFRLAGRSTDDVFKARLIAEESPSIACQRLSRDADVEWAEPDHHRFIQTTLPNDPNVFSQWYLSAVNAAAAWKITTGDPNTVIAVIDTGVAWNHPDLAGNIWINVNEISNDVLDNDANGYTDDIRGWDFVSVPASEVFPGEDPGPDDNNPIDVHGHGTQMAGIAAARGNNGIGVAGICWDCKIMPVRAGYKNRFGQGVLQVSDIAPALQYAADNGADIINMSYGSSSPSMTEKLAIDLALEAGCALIAAAGNDATDAPMYPASFDGVTSVAALNFQRRRSVYSNFGTSIDVAAPGDALLTTLPGSSYDQAYGTSAACALVSGVAGLLKSEQPGWSASTIATRLRATAENINALNEPFVNLLGGGIVRPDLALDATESPTRIGVVHLRGVERGFQSEDAWDSGEIIDLQVAVRNFGDAHPGVVVSLSTEDPHVLIVDGTSVIGFLPADGIVSAVSDPMTVVLADDIPSDHRACLRLTASSFARGFLSVDEMLIRLNPLLGSPRQLTDHPPEFDYILPGVNAGKGDRIDVLYQSNGFVENQIYARGGAWGQSWLPAVQVSQSSGILAARQHHAAPASDGTLHVSFLGVIGPFDGEIFHVRRDPKNGSWTPPQQISRNAKVFDSAIIGFDAPNVLAVDGQSHPHVVWADYRSGGPQFFHVLHNGVSWTSEALIATLFGEPTSLELSFDGRGEGYLLWSHAVDGNIQYMIHSGGVWSPPMPAVSVSLQGPFAFTVDSSGVPQLAFSAPNGDDVSHRRFDAGTWSDPQIVMQDTFVFGGGISLTAADANRLHLTRLVSANFLSGDASIQLHETWHDGVEWSPSRPLTHDRTGLMLSDIAVTLNSNDDRLVVGALDTDPTNGLSFAADSDIVLFHSDRDASFLPARPLVVDDGTVTTDATSLHVSWSADSGRGFLESRLSVGRYPGGNDVRDWLSVGNVQETVIDLTTTPLTEGQMYFLGVRVRNQDGFWSPVGSSDGIEFRLCDARPYGDVYPPEGNDVVDVSDIICVLDGYDDLSLCPNGDIHPCIPNGQIDLDDIVAVLDAFAHLPLCPDDCL